MIAINLNSLVRISDKLGWQYKRRHSAMRTNVDKSSTVAEMGDRGHNRHGPKRGGAVPLSRGAGNTSNTMCPAPRSTSVPSGVFINKAVWPQRAGCHSRSRNISTNYYLVVEMHTATATVRSDDARYLLN